MANFKINSRKQVNFDPDVFKANSASVWVRNTVTGAPTLRTPQPDLSSGPPNVSEYLGETDNFGRIKQGLCLNIDAGRNMFIAGFQDTSIVGKVSGRTDPDYLEFVGGTTFERRALTSTDVEFLRRFQGYPFYILTRMIRRGLALTWPDNDPDFRVGLDNVPNLGSPIGITAWLPIIGQSADQVQLVDINGDPLKWPLGRSITGVDQIPNRSAYTPSDPLPAFASFFPIDKNDAATVAGKDAILHRFTDAATANNMINGISTAYAITSPSRVDASGIQQSETFPSGVLEGKIEVVTSAASSLVPDYSAGSFWATVVASSFEPNLISEQTGDTFLNSVHYLTLDVADRVAAGLADTPITIDAPVFPQYQIEGREYFISQITEGFESDLQIVLASRRGR